VILGNEAVEMGGAWRLSSLPSRWGMRSIVGGVLPFRRGKLTVGGRDLGVLDLVDWWGLRREAR
jgi:hypothetical protein